MSRYTFFSTRTVVAFAMLLAFAVTTARVRAAFTDTFESDVPPAQPANWTIGGANGSTVTANVASEPGPNRFVALRDTVESPNLSLDRSLGAGDTQGFVRFDIRFNGGQDDITTIRLMSGNLEPVGLSWFHNAHNPIAFPDLILSSRGNGSGFGAPDPNGHSAVTSSFTKNSWQTITIFFESYATTPTWGKYWVSWNGISKEYHYLNQGGSPPVGGFAINRFLITQSGPGISVDIDNVMFVPEPTGALALAGAASMLGLVRNRRIPRARN